MTTNEATALKASRETPAATISGYPMLLLFLFAAATTAYGVYRIAGDDWDGALAMITLGSLLMAFATSGFYMLQPNEAAAITLFGDYRGTDRSTGLR